MKRTKQQDEWHRRGFASGIAVAAGIIVSIWGEEVAAREILASAGLDTREKCRRLGVEAYDLDQLKPVFADIKRRKARRK